MIEKVEDWIFFLYIYEQSKNGKWENIDKCNGSQNEINSGYSAFFFLLNYNLKWLEVFLCVTTKVLSFIICFLCYKLNVLGGNTIIINTEVQTWIYFRSSLI